MFKFFSWPLAGALLALAVLGCRTVPPLPPARLDAPGWTVQHGEAVWHRGALDLAGELIVAHSGTDRSLVQFSKGPLQIVTARREHTTWEIQFPMQNKFYSGRGNPPGALGWLQLAPAANGQPPSKGWKWTSDNNHWRLERGSEFIEGVFSE